MAITDPGQLKFVAEGIRPAADRIIGGYDSALPLISAWDDADDATKLTLWESVSQMATVVWSAFIDSDALVYPWDDLLGITFPDDATDIDDNHSKPITSAHVHRVVECVRHVATIANDNSGAWRKALFAVKSYTATPADIVALTGFIAGLKALVSYIDDDANDNNRRKRTRETAVNPNLRMVELPG